MKKNLCCSTVNYKFFSAMIMVFMVGCFLIGCEKSTQTTAPFKQATKKYPVATTLEGLVSDNNGPIKTGTIKVTDNNDKLVASAAIQNNGHYSVEIPANTVLPIVLSFYPDAADSNKEKMITAVVHPTITKYDINPLSTSIAKAAHTMGGYTHANLVRAAEGTATVPDANKTTAGFRGDPTTQYSGWH